MRKSSRSWRSLCRISKSTGTSSLNFRLDFKMNAAGPAPKIGMARWAADCAIDKIRDRFGWEAIGYGSVALGISRSVPDEFRELAEKDL